MRKKNEVLCQDSTNRYVTSLRDASNIIERKIIVAARRDKISKSDIRMAM